MIDRKLLLKKLIRFDDPVETMPQLLRPFGWDSDTILVILRREDIIFVLDRYLQSGLSALDVEQWANAIEGREDIGYEAGYGSSISATIHTLANPFLTTPLNIQTAKELIGQLK